MHFTTNNPRQTYNDSFTPKLKCLMESSAGSDYHHLFGLATSAFHTPARTHTHIPQIPNYKEQRSVRRCLIKTTDQLTAQLAWLIRGSVGTKARSPLLSLSAHVHTHTPGLTPSHWV